MDNVFRLVIKCEGAAFEDGDAELVRLLRKLADMVNKSGVGYGGGRIIDHNGNAAGEWTYAPEYSSLETFHADRIRRDVANETGSGEGS